MISEQPPCQAWIRILETLIDNEISNTLLLRLYYSTSIRWGLAEVQKQKQAKVGPNQIKYLGRHEVAYLTYQYRL